MGIFFLIWKIFHIEKHNEISCPNAWARKSICNHFTIHKHVLFSHSLFFCVFRLKCNSALNSGLYKKISEKKKMLSHALLYTDAPEMPWIVTGFLFFMLTSKWKQKKSEKIIIYWRDYSIQVSWITICIVAHRKQWKYLTFESKKKRILLNMNVKRAGKMLQQINIALTAKLSAR